MSLGTTRPAWSERWWCSELALPDDEQTGIPLRSANPTHGRTRGSLDRARRWSRRLVAAALAALVSASLASSVGADTKDELERARATLVGLAREIDSSTGQLLRLDDEIAAEEARLDALQDDLTVLAGKIDAAQSRYARTQERISDTEARIEMAKRQYRSVRRRLDARARQVYVDGPAGALSVLLGSGSVAELTDRMEFSDELAEDDAMLANQAQNQANALAMDRAELKTLEGEQQLVLKDLEADEAAVAEAYEAVAAARDAVAAKRAEQSALVSGLRSKHDDIIALIDSLETKLRAEEIARARAAAEEAAAEAAAREAAEAAEEEASQEPDPPPPEEGDGGDGGAVPPPIGSGPFFVCPVDGPSYVDSFGAPRVGHAHAGNDLMAPLGTPIRAPFAGRAEASSNSLGGLTVNVYGPQGYVYNAHLSAYGTTGNVSAGTIIGYVGNTGNASGGPYHDHFEWHPNVIPSSPWTSPYGYSIIGDAIDPYPYLNAVC